jgi:ferritin
VAKDKFQFLEAMNAKLWVFLGLLLRVGASNNCDSLVNQGCDVTKSFQSSALKECTAQWGAFSRPELQKETNELVALKITNSMKYLFQASYFKRWDVNRPGFNAFFNKLSDEEWTSAIDLMIHMVKRGGKLYESFQIQIPAGTMNDHEREEMRSLAWALDLEKDMANKALHLAYDANHAKDSTTKRDEAFTNYIAETINHQTVMRIKHLSNYVNMLGQIILSTVDKGYAFFTFDHEILK